MFVEEISVLIGLHIDKVYDHNASHISQTNLACNLVGSIDVDVKGVVLLLPVFGTDATIHIDYVQCFGVFDDKVCTLA